MALAIGSIVRPAVGLFWTPQPPDNGRVVQNPGAGTNDVLFDNGELAPAVPDAQLDSIVTASDPTRDAFIGRIVRPKQSTTAPVLLVSQEYTGEVIGVYSVTTGGGGGPFNRVLVKLLSTGAYVELDTSALDILPDR